MKTDVVCVEQMTKPFKRTWCPFRRSKFEFQHPHDCSQPPVTIQGDVIPSSALYEYYIQYT